VWTWVAGDGSIHSVEDRRLDTARPPAASTVAGRMRDGGGRWPGRRAREMRGDFSCCCFSF
jgi:hypothetical protein